MTSRHPNVDPIGAGTSLLDSSVKPFQYAVTAFLFVLAVYALLDYKNDPPRLNPKKTFEFTTRRLLEEYTSRGKEVLYRAREKYGQRPYRLYSDFGDVVVLPAESIHEIRNNPALSFIESSAHVSMPLGRSLPTVL